MLENEWKQIRPTWSRLWKQRLNQDYHHFISQVAAAAFKAASEDKNTIYHVLFSDEALDVTIREGFLESL